MAKTDSQLLSSNRRRLRFAAAAVAFGVLFLGFFLFTSRTLEAPISVVPQKASDMVLAGPSLPAAQPLQLKIPKLNITAPFETPLGLTETGEIAVPESYDKVAYYMHGPTPGEFGPAVVLGHVDSYEGPAVFFSLGQLTIGDEIVIERTDGTTATFAVTEMERRPQTDFPTAKVYGDVSFAGLRLITCTGIYDHDELRYSHNLIVFAQLVATSSVRVE